MNKRTKQLGFVALGIAVIGLAVFIICAVTSREVKMSVSINGDEAAHSSGYYYTLCAGDQFDCSFSCTTSEHMKEEDCILTIKKVAKDHVTIDSYGHTINMRYGVSMELKPHVMIYDGGPYNTSYTIRFTPNCKD